MAGAKKKARPPRSDDALLRAFASSDYGVYSGAEQELEAWFSAHPDEALVRAKRIAKLALTKAHAAARQRAGYLVLPVLAASLPPKSALPAVWDPLVSAFGEVESHRAVLSTIPEPRLTAIFDREIRANQNAESRIAEHFLDLAPEVTTTILERAAARGELKRVASWGYLTQWRRKSPRIAAILKQYEARAKKEAPPAPPRKAKGTLTFREPRAVAPSHYAGLGAVEKAQYRGAAEAYLGGKVRDAKHFVARLEAEDMTEGDALMCRWTVTQGGEHRYDVWVVWVDNATIFEAGTAKRAPVHQIQGTFQALDRKAASARLAEDFENSAPRSVWVVGGRS